MGGAGIACGGTSAGAAAAGGTAAVTGGERSAAVDGAAGGAGGGAAGVAVAALPPNQPPPAVRRLREIERRRLLDLRRVVEEEEEDFIFFLEDDVVISFCALEKNGTGYNFFYSPAKSECTGTIRRGGTTIIPLFPLSLFLSFSLSFPLSTQQKNVLCNASSSTWLFFYDFRQSFFHCAIRLV